MARADMLSMEPAIYGGLTTSADALFELGLRYSTGRDCDVDFVAAHKWFNLAALKGNMAARDYRKELSEEMTKSQVAEAQKLAREWLRSH
ncbi:MAG: SEL1-like repeat protein [Hyphomicrobiaceae bacterium]